MSDIAQLIATELGVRPAQVAATIQLLDEGATVPFIARYRKEVTGALDDTQLRALTRRLDSLRQLEQRRQSILSSLRESDQLTDALERALNGADSRQQLEDLYLPYRPKRNSKAEKAKEAGLAPLASQLQKLKGAPDTLAAGFINPEKGINDSSEALAGAEQILWAEAADQGALVSRLREQLKQSAQLTARATRGKTEEAKQRFADYLDYAEALKKIPSHRALALLRGEKAGLLKLQLETEEEPLLVGQVQAALSHEKQGDRAARDWLQGVSERCWQKKLLPSLQTELVNQLRESADTEAVKVFSRNLSDLLLAAPAGGRAVIGLDPGLRTGVKVAVLDATGKLLDHLSIFPHAPRNQWDQSLHQLAELAKRYPSDLIAIGNGTASRETEKLARELCRLHPDLKLTPVVVSEAGASVYSASELAAEEFPELDVSYRGAVSIARRLQDPLAELVKIDPKAIGVGQYQHDVDQSLLAGALDDTVEDCVNHVGVDLNTASAPLLSRVAGLNPALSRNIVAHRDQIGSFRRRDQLLKVKRLGPKTYQQAAAFLRIRDGEEALDNSAVHPESYPLAERIAKQLGCTVAELPKRADQLQRIDPRSLVDANFGEYTVTDVLKELAKPGRDPRPEFRTATFDEQVQTMSDLKEGMTLEGTVTNVTNFGAFVDIGVHQDGLVHISQLSDQFVKDPHEVVKTGQIVKVRVTEIDLPRKRIGLSMKSPDGSSDQRSTASRQEPDRANSTKGKRPNTANPRTQGPTTLAASFAAAGWKTRK